MRKSIFDSTTPFTKRALEVFNFQRENNPVYNRFCEVFGFKQSISSDISVSNLPIIPIRVFKEAEIRSFTGEPEILFQSSGTSQMQKSKHFVFDASIYVQSIEKEFYRHFPQKETSIFCYTPGYSDNPNSSLVWMLNHLVKQDPSGLSSFLPLGKPLNYDLVDKLIESNRNIVLFGAAFGLIDLLEMNSDTLPPSSHIIETGGMKTHRREMTKKELRNQLSEGFHLPKKHVHSEYGMCELLSQCYAVGGEWFDSPHWVHVSVRDPHNPERICEPGEEGKIGIIDLANLYSCSFILTDDKGIMNKDGHFKVLGRWDDQDLRGCNFLIDNEIE